MKSIVVIVSLFVCCLSCSIDREENAENEKKRPDSEMVFNKAKWRVKDGAIPK